MVMNDKILFSQPFGSYPCVMQWCCYFDISSWVDFVHSIPWSPACFPVQVVALHKDSMVTETSHPHVSLSATLQLHTLTNVEPGTGQRASMGRKGRI